MRACGSGEDDEISPRFLLCRRSAQGNRRPRSRRHRAPVAAQEPACRALDESRDLAEVLEGAEDVDAVRAYLSRYGWQASTASRRRPRRVCSAVARSAEALSSRGETTRRKADALKPAAWAEHA